MPQLVHRLPLIPAKSSDNLFDLILILCGFLQDDKDVKGGWKHLRFCQALTDDATGGMNEYDSLLDLLRFIETSLHNLLLGNVQKSRNAYSLKEIWRIYNTVQKLIRNFVVEYRFHFLALMIAVDWLTFANYFR